MTQYTMEVKYKNANTMLEVTHTERDVNTGEIIPVL